MNSHYGYPERKDFLINMYNQLCSEINRHINIIWQIMGVLLSTFAVYALVDKDIINLDLATSIILLVCALNVAIVIESNYWYNRNLVIIANIERQFLFEEDLKDIHWYFSSHRRNNALLDMMKIQIVFVGLLAVLVLGYHFIKRVYPNMGQPNSHFDLIRALPYLMLTVTLVFIIIFYRKRINNYNSFKAKSPGITIQTASQFSSDSDHVI